MTIQVRISNNLERDTVLVDSARTLKSVLEENGVDYGRGNITLDGSVIPAGGLERTFDYYGITERCYLSAVVKADNA